MTDLSAIYRQALPGRIAALEQAAGRAGQDAEAAASVRRIAHALRGSGGTYGFPEVSIAAAAAEDAAEGELIQRVDELLATLRSIVAVESSTHILAIEDEPEHALLIRTILAKEERKVTVVGTAAEAMQELAAGRVSLILLDLMLPDMDGRSLLLRLREAEATAALPIIVLSAHSSSRAKAECFDLGASGYLEKPIDPALLAAVVGAELRTARSAASAETGDEGGGVDGGDSAPAIAGDGDTDQSCVLVVEDDELVASILGHRLERDGLRMLHCSDGVSALEVIQNERIALAILDVKLPGVDGFEVLSGLRRYAGTADTPVIMLTSMGAEKDVLRAFDLGANDYITKPFSPVEVLARVKRLLRTHGHASP